MSRSLPPFGGRAGDAPASAASTITQLLQCLKDEGDALVAADADKLAQAVVHKELVLRRLAVELAPADQPALREAIGRARDLNERNARLLAPHIRINRARIESLLGPARAVPLYSSGGRAAGVENRPAQRGVRA